LALFLTFSQLQKPGWLAAPAPHSTPGSGPPTAHRAATGKNLNYWPFKFWTGCFLSLKSAEICHPLPAQILQQLIVLQQASFSAVFRIHDILVRILIPIQI
jgi:hypothetical protein